VVDILTTYLLLDYFSALYVKIISKSNQKSRNFCTKWCTKLNAICPRLIAL